MGRRVSEENSCERDEGSRGGGEWDWRAAARGPECTHLDLFDGRRGPRAVVAVDAEFDVEVVQHLQLRRELQPLFLQLPRLRLVEELDAEIAVDELQALEEVPPDLDQPLALQHLSALLDVNHHLTLRLPDELLFRFGKVGCGLVLRLGFQCPPIVGIHGLRDAPRRPFTLARSRRHPRPPLEAPALKPYITASCWASPCLSLPPLTISPRSRPLLPRPPRDGAP